MDRTALGDLEKTIAALDRNIRLLDKVKQGLAKGIAMPAANIMAVLAGIWQITHPLTNLNFSLSQNDSKSQIGGAVGGAGAIAVAGFITAMRYKDKKGWRVIGDDPDVVATLSKLQKTLQSVRDRLNPAKKKRKP
jgi:hypothetical protein